MTHTVLQLFDLRGKTALVTGDPCGRGLQMAHALGEAGARIMLAARVADDLEQAVADLQGAGIDARWVAADCTQEADLRRLVDETLHRMGDVDILVNNAGATWGVPTTETVLQAWDTVVNLNVRGYLMLSQLVAQKSMLERRWGRIINVASMAALGDSPGVMRTIACRTSRDAIVNCTQTLAAEWEQYNITVNAICAGFPPARMTPNTRGDDMLPAQVPSPRGRHEAGEGLKGVCVLFASDAGQHITGQCLAVGDGVSAMSACINNHRKDKTEP